MEKNMMKIQHIILITVGSNTIHHDQVTLLNTFNRIKIIINALNGPIFIYLTLIN